LQHFYVKYKVFLDSDAIYY